MSPPSALKMVLFPTPELPASMAWRPPISSRSGSISPSLRIDDDRGILQGAINAGQLLAFGVLGKVGLGQHDRGGDFFQLGKSKQLVEGDGPRRRIGQRGYGNEQIDVRGHRLRTAAGAMAP